MVLHSCNYNRRLDLVIKASRSGLFERIVSSEEKELCPG